MRRLVWWLGCRLRHWEARELRAQAAQDWAVAAVIEAQRLSRESWHPPT